MNAIKIERDATGTVTMTTMALNTKTWFADVQTLCGGYIELGYTTKGERTKRGSAASLDLWANEDGIALGLAPTVQLIDPMVDRTLTLFGTVVLVAATKAYGKPRDMTEKERASIELINDMRTGIRINPTSAVLSLPTLRLGL